MQKNTTEAVPPKSAVVEINMVDFDPFFRVVDAARQVVDAAHAHGSVTPHDESMQMLTETLSVLDADDH